MKALYSFSQRSQIVKDTWTAERRLEWSKILRTKSHPKAPKWSDEEVRSIRKASMEGKTFMELIAHYGISKGALHGILTHKTYKHVEDCYK